MNIGKIMILFPLLLILLYGCNTAEEGNTSAKDTTTNQTATETTDGNTITQEDTSAMTTPNEAGRTILGNAEGGEPTHTLSRFSNFELDVEYANNLSYEVEFIQEETGVRAKVEDELNNVYLSGDEAKNNVMSTLESLTFDENTEDSEIVIQILTAFDLTDDFIKMELEVRYDTGTVKEYNFTS